MTFFDKIDWNDIHMHEYVIIRRRNPRIKWYLKVTEDTDSLVMGEWFKKKNK